MAGPEVPQHGPLNIGYSTGTSVYQPGNVAVPQGAGQLWQNVGKTALDAAGQFQSTMQQSALNPVVRAQMKEDVLKAQAGQKITQHAIDNPQWLYKAGGEGPRGSGATLTAPITEPVTQQTDLESPPAPPPPPNPNPTITRTGTNTGTDETGKQYHETTPGSNKWVPGKPTPPPPANLNSGMAQGGLVRGYADGGQVSPDTKPDEAHLNQMALERQAQGLGTRMFLNPVTGAYEPSRDQPPAVSPIQSAPPQSSSIWSPMRPLPMAPPAPTGQPQPTYPEQQSPSQTPAAATRVDQAAMQPVVRSQTPAAATQADQANMQPPAQSQTPAAATQADQAAMQKWQEQNAHPVMSSQDALSWMKNQTTLAQDATYLPMGGPGGSPAFAFHIKGGGINTVPVSQMVAKGAGPLVAAQNTSQVISSTDQAQQPNISPPPPANLPQQPNISPPPPPNLPPAAPGVAPMPTGTGAAATQPVSATLGPPPAPSMQSGTGAGAQQPVSVTGGPQPASTTPGYNMLTEAAPYPKLPGTQDFWTNQFLTQPIPSANGAAPSAQTGPRLIPASAQKTEPVTTEAKPTTDPSSPEAIKAMEADDPNGANIYHWNAERQSDGSIKYYTELPDKEGGFRLRRYYKGDLTGFQSGLWNDEARRKQQLLEEYGGPAGIPMPVDPATGKKIVLDKEHIDGLSTEDQNKWLEHARDWKNHNKAPTLSDPEGQNLSNAGIALQAAQRIYDKVKYLSDNHIPMSTVSQSEMVRSREAGYAAGANNPGEWALWNMMAQDGPKNIFADELGSDYKQFHDHASKVLGGSYATAATPTGEKWDPELPIPIGEQVTKVGVPPVERSTDVSNINALKSISQGDTWDQAVAHAQEVLENAKRDYKKAAAQLPPAGWRLPDTDQKNMFDLDKKGRIDDPTNMMYDKPHDKIVNGHGPIPYLANWFPTNQWKTYDGDQSAQSAAASATPSKTPTLTSWDTKELDKLNVKKGDAFIGPDGKPYHRTQ
jgi:hypothetical protein